MKNNIRLLVRRILKIKEKENIKDGILRHRFNIIKKLNKKKFSLKQFEEALRECGLETSDNVFIQSSWRAFVGFEATPHETIQMIRNIIGQDGTMLMPSFSYNNTNINIEEDKTSLGVLAETFRTSEGTVRSLDSYFPICSNGKYAEEMVIDHIESVSPFDEKSPLNKVLEMEGKLIFLGLGRYPYKVSFVHFFMYRLSRSKGFNKEIFNKQLNCEIVSKNKVLKKNIFVRSNIYQNNNRAIKKAMKIVKHKYRKTGFLDIYVCNSKDLMDVFENMDKEGFSFYKVGRKNA